MNYWGLGFLTQRRIIKVPLVIKFCNSKFLYFSEPPFPYFSKAGFGKLQPMGQIRPHPQPIFVNKVLLEQSQYILSKAAFTLQQHVS